MCSDLFIEMFCYKLWADERTLHSVERINMNDYPESDRFIRQQLNHMVIVEELFRARLQKQALPHKATNTNDLPGLSNLTKRLRNSNEWYQGYVSKLTLSQKTTTLRIQFADGQSGAMTVEEILFHIINHGSYHRGCIARALDLADVAHPSDGYAIYIHQVDPIRRI